MIDSLCEMNLKKKQKRNNAVTHSFVSLRVRLPLYHRLLCPSLALSPSPPHCHYPVSDSSDTTVPSHYYHPADLVFFFFLFHLIYYVVFVGGGPYLHFLVLLHLL